MGELRSEGGVPQPGPAWGREPRRSAPAFWCLGVGCGAFARSLALGRGCALGGAPVTCSTWSRRTTLRRSLAVALG